MFEIIVYKRFIFIQDMTSFMHDTEFLPSTTTLPVENTFTCTGDQKSSVNEGKSSDSKLTNLQLEYFKDRLYKFNGSDKLGIR